MKAKKHNPLLFALFSLAGFSLTVTPGRAADATWTGNGAQPFGSAIWGGLGNWNTGSPASGAGFTATFGSSFTNGPAVTLNVATTIGTIVYTDPANANDFQIKQNATSPPSLTLNNNGPSPVINVTQSGRTLTVDPVVLGTAGLSKTGPGTLKLTAANTFSGATKIVGGTLFLISNLGMQSSVLDTASSVAGDATSGLKISTTTLTLSGLSGDKNLSSVFTTSSGGFSGITALTLNSATGASNSYSGNIADGATGMNLVKSGAGTQVFSGTNSYTGTTTVSAGILVTSSTSALPGYNSAGKAIFNGGTIAVSVGGSGWSTSQIDTLLANATKTSGGFGIDTTSGNLAQWTSFTVANLGTLGLTKSGSNTLTLNQANTYTGTTTVGGGTLALTATATLGAGTGGLTLSGGTLDLGTLSPATGAVSITAAAASGDTIANGSLTGTSYAASNTSGTAIVSATLLGAGGFTKSGAGSVVLSGTNNFSGNTAVNASGGILQFAKTASLYNGTTASWTAAKLKAGSAGTLAFNVGGTNEFTNGDVTTLLTNLGGANASSTAGFASGSNIGFDTTNASGGTLTVSDLIANTSAGSLGVVKLGSGTLILSAANTNTGVTTVSGGQLTLADRGAATMGTVTVAGAAGAILELSGAAATYSLGASSLFVGSTTNGTLNQTAGTVSFTSGNALLIGNGTGSSGTYNLSGGTFTSFSSTTRGVMLGVNASNSATFNLSGTGTLSIPSSILMVGRSDAAAAGTVNLFTQTDDNSSATVGTLSIGGTGTANTNSTLTLTGGTFVANTFSKLATATNDVTTINIGGSADVTLPAFPTTRGSGATATLTFNGGTLRPLVASSTYIGGLTNAFIKAGGAKFDTTNGDTSISQALLTDVSSTGGGLTKDGGNTLTLTGANTYTGATAVLNGRLQLDGAAAAGAPLSTTGVTVSSGATLGFTAGTASGLNLTGKSLSLGGSLAFDLGASGVNDSVTVDSFSLTGNSSFSFNPIGAIANGGSYTLLTSANPINTNGFTISGQSAGRLILTPTINTNTITLTPVLLEGTWNQTGGGAWETGNPSATGGNWNNYKPTVPGDAALFGSAITAPSTISLGSSQSVAYLRFDNATNAYTLGAPGSFNLNMDNGAATATITVSSGSHTIAEGVNLASNVSVVPSAGTALEVSGGFGGSASLQLVDAGTLILSGDNTYTGSTTVSAGTLQLGNGGSDGWLNINSPISLATGAFFRVSRDNTVNQGSDFSSSPITGAGGFSQAGTGLTVLSAVNTFTGPTTISGGFLQISGSGKLGNGAYAGAISIADGSKFQYGSSSAQTLSGSISGAGMLVKELNSSSTLTVSGNNSYTGGTTIQAGIVNVATSANALGTGDVTFNGGSRLVVDTGLELTNPITIGSNNGASGRGLVEAGTLAGTTKVSGLITINNSTASGVGHFAAPTANTVLHVAGQITSSAPVNSRVGTVMLSGGGTGYTNLGIGQGTVMVGANNGIATTASVVGGTYGASILDLNGFNQSLEGMTKDTLASTTVGNSSTTSDSTLTTTGTSTFAGTIIDRLGLGTRTVSLIVNGGSLTLTGGNAYTGATSVNAGTLALVGGTQASPITVSPGASLGFTLGSPTTSTSTFNLSAGTIRITGTPTLASYTLISSSAGITGSPTLDTAIPGYALQVDGNALKLVQAGYDAWAQANGLDNSDPAHSSVKSDDPDGDGRNNLYEFAFDGNPLSGATDGKVVGKIATVAGNQVMTLTVPARTGAAFSSSSGDQLSALINGIYYRIEGDVDLATLADTITEVTGGDASTIQTGLPTLSIGWTYRTFRAPGTIPTVSSSFLRAKISETP